MSSKIAQIREALIIAQDLAKAHILFVPVPVLNEADHELLKAKMALRIMQMAEEASPLGEKKG